MVPDTVMGILKTSCYDCHSNHTAYPWYANISPLNLFLANHVKEGKKELNFSDFAQYSRRRINNKLSAIAEQVKDGEMPIKSYTLMHAAAKLTDGEAKLILEWVDRAKQELKQKDE